MRAADRLDEGEGVGGAGERGAGVVHGGVEVLQREDPPGALAQLGQPGQGPGGEEPHRRGDHLGGHDREALGVEVLGGPVPDLDLEPEAGDPPDPLGERQVEEHHLRGHRQPEPAHVATSSIRTGRPAPTDSAAASAIASAARASSPPAGTGAPVRTASVKAASSATYALARSSWSLRTVSTDRPAAPEKTIPVRRPSPMVAIPWEPRTSPRTS